MFCTANRTSTPFVTEPKSNPDTQGDSYAEKTSADALLLPTVKSQAHPPALPFPTSMGQDRKGSSSFGYLSHGQHTSSLLKPSLICLKLNRCKCRKDAAITPGRAIKPPVLKSIFLWGQWSTLCSSFELHVYEMHRLHFWKQTGFNLWFPFIQMGGNLRQSEKLAWIVLDSWIHKYISL